MDEKELKLQKLIKEKNIHKEGIDFLLKYYEESLHWSHEQAVEYTISLFENGTIDDIKIIGGKDNGKTS